MERGIQESEKDQTLKVFYVFLDEYADDKRNPRKEEQTIHIYKEKEVESEKVD